MLLALPVGMMELIIIGVVLGLNVLPLVGIISAASFDRPVWNAAGRSKVTWIALQFFLPLLGPILYLAMVRPGLHALGGRRRY